MATKEEIYKELLKKTVVVLERHWFSDNGESNNNDIIYLQEEIREVLEGE